MREINLSKYSITVMRPNPQTGMLEPTIGDYDVKESLLGLMFTRDLQLNARDLLLRDPLGRKITEAGETTILLEDSEHEILKKSVEAFKGYTRNEVELVRRVLEAKTVEVEKKIPKGEPVNVVEPGATQ